jgi:flavin-dependent dehydrogenase
MRYWQDKMGIDLGELRASYGWVFPKGDHLSVGVGGLPMIEDYGSHLKRYDSKHTSLSRARSQAVIRSHGYLLPCRRAGAPVQKGRALLVGDAAGLVEAFTGEGIYWAIKSGQIAAHAILNAETQRVDSQSPLLGYQRMLDEALMPDLLSARHWFRVYVSMPRACYSLPRRIPMFWRSVCRVMRGERRYRDIKQRLGPLGFVEGLLADPLLSARN